MEMEYKEQGLRERLILAGLKELEEHGISDFSLRRVASLAEVSCAAPYRHFKDKEELVLSIISYVREGWTLLAENISELCLTEPQERVLRLSVAGARFWIANRNFRSVLMSGQGELDAERRKELSLFDSPIIDAVEQACPAEARSAATFRVLALIYGSVSLVCEGAYPPEEAIELLKGEITEALSFEEKEN